MERPARRPCDSAGGSAGARRAGAVTAFLIFWTRRLAIAAAAMLALSLAAAAQKPAPAAKPKPQQPAPAAAPTAPPNAPDLDMAYGAFQRGYFVTACSLATKRVDDKADPKSMTLIGKLYADGLGMPQDDQKAAE